MRIRGSPALQALAGFVVLFVAAAAAGYAAGAQRSAASGLAWGLVAVALVLVAVVLAVAVVRGAAGGRLQRVPGWRARLSCGGWAAISMRWRSR